MPVAYVTGAAGGIGQAVVAGLAAAGYRVARFDLAQMAGPDAFTLDVTDAGSVERAMAEAEAALPPCDLLVNNAGTFSVCAPLWDCDPDLWTRDIRVNLVGTFLMCRRVSRGMVARGSGRIVNVVSSGGVLDAHPYGTSYAASKTGATRMTEGLAQELAPHGCQAFALGPPAVATAMTKWLIDDPQARTWRPLIGEIFERGEDHPPETVAAAVVLLASGRADMLSGRYFLPHRDMERMIEDARGIQAEDAWVLRISGYEKD